MNTNAITEKRPRGRPRTFDRDQALQTAMGLFWTQGYAGTSTAQLAGAIGITPPSLYLAFGSKEGLLTESLEFYRTGIGAAPVHALLAAPDCKSGIAALLTEAVVGFTGNAATLGCFIACGELQTAVETADVAARFAALRLAAKQTIKAYMQNGLAAGALPLGTDIEALSTYFATIVQGLAVQAHDGASPETLFAVIELAMTVWPN